jgi:hypothetical protein
LLSLRELGNARVLNAIENLPFRDRVGRSLCQLLESLGNVQWGRLLDVEFNESNCADAVEIESVGCLAIRVEAGNSQG